MIRSRAPSLWRYREALPIDDDASIISFQEGFTPLLHVRFGSRSVRIKQDQLLPTGSYKDRGAAVLVSKTKELGIREVVEDSSGNAGSSIAAYCAAAGIRCHIFVPEATSPAKTRQIEAYGARLHKIPGNREDCARAAKIAAESMYYASHVWNPFFLHGTKTFAYEICEQMGWRVPDTVILPVGNGTLLLGAWIGFRNLRKAGITSSLPRLIAVQAQNCAPLARAFHAKSGDIACIETTKTIAEGIAIARPARGAQILEAVRDSHGDFITVDEHEIVQAHQEMAHRGFFIEPTAAACIAGVKKYLPLSPPDEDIVSVFTGHGLKAG